MGGKPLYTALVEAPEQGAVIEVSDERASSGRHSLKFVDTAEAPIYYHTRICWTPNLVGDMRYPMTFRPLPRARAMLWTGGAIRRAMPRLARVSIDADGHLLFEPPPSEVYLPDSQWLHFEIETGLGALGMGPVAEDHRRGWGQRSSRTRRCPAIRSSTACFGWALCNGMAPR